MSKKQECKWKTEGKTVFPQTDPKPDRRGKDKGGCKCANTDDIVNHPEKKRFMTSADCGMAANANGYKYFNWHEGKKWCYFGRFRGESSEKNNCDGTNQVETLDPWGIYTSTCKTYEAGWFLGAPDASCTATCTFYGLQCTEAGMEGAHDSVSTSDNMLQTLKTLKVNPLSEEEAAILHPCEKVAGNAVPTIILKDTAIDSYCAFPPEAKYSCGSAPTENRDKQRLCYCVV